MISRIGHVAHRVGDLDRAVDFQERVLGLVETERRGGVSYLTCNQRHHEMVLIGDRGVPGVEYIGLEVADAAALEEATRRIPAAGGRILRAVGDGGPGIEQALLAVGPEGHVFKIFHGMASVGTPSRGDRPTKFEHVSLKVRHPRRFERFLTRGLGFGFSDRMGLLASWWHCDTDHHGLALVWAPHAAQSHYAFTFPDLSSIGRTVDRLKAERDRRLVWGVSRHGPGDNHFAYLLDDDGAMVELCSDIAQMDGTYVPRRWPITPFTINKWGGPPPLRFLRAEFPLAPISA